MKRSELRSGPGAQWPSQAQGKARCLLPSAFCRLSLRGQAMIEFAVMGSVALLALTMLIQMGLRMNYQQEIQQDAFRQAMRIAQNEGDNESQAIQYNAFRNRRTPNPSEGVGVMPRVLTQGNATVTWGEWLTYLNQSRDSQPRIIVNLDDQSEREFRSEDFIDVANQPLVRRITKDLTGSGKIQQNNFKSTLASDTTESTTMELSNGASLTSSVDTNIRYNW